MLVELHRRWETSLSVCGQMSIEGLFQNYTLEPARNNPVHLGHPCIVAGTFDVILTHSPHLGYTTPEVLNVPGRTAIRWHVANKPEDVLGCAGVGRVRGINWVGESKLAFQAMMEKLNSSTDGIKVIYTEEIQ